MAAGVQRRGHAESRPRGLTEVALVSGLPRPRGSLGWGCNLLEDSCCWALETDDVGQRKPLLKQGSWPCQARRCSCLKVRVKVISACSGALWGRVTALLCGYSAQCSAGCKNNTDAVAALVRRPRGRLGWGRNLGEEWDASSPSQRSSVSHEGSVLVVCWVRLLTLL